jgi:DUF971 family protein
VIEQETGRCRPDEKAMEPYPTTLQIIEPDGLLIVWSDGQTRQYSFQELRASCPCATCREDRTGEQSRPAGGLPVLSLQEAQPVRIASMKPVGNYAYSIQFNDGHDTGIFTMEYLRELGREVAG